MTDISPAIGVEIDASPQPSAVSWGAIIAGASVAIALTLALIVFGSGLGLTLVSPWWEANADATTIGVSTIAFLVITQWVSSGVGGYLTGRLRTRWSVGSDEVFFRDTAHGFIVWAVATIVVAGIASHSLMGLAGAGAQIVGQAAGGAAMGAAQETTESLADPTAYFVDSLYRPAQPEGSQPPAPAASAPAGGPAATEPPAPPVGVTPAAPAQAPMSPDANAASANAASVEDRRGETLRIIARGKAADTFPEADRSYLVQRVAAETGMSQQQADARVTQVLQGLTDAKAEAQQAAEEAREAAVTLAVVTFVSLLVGAFIGAVAAALGGSHRDDGGEATIARY